MLNKFHFLLLLLFTNRHKHYGVFFLSTILVSVLVTFLLISNSIEKDMQATLENQADITIQRYVSGHRVDIPLTWVDEFLKIPGVQNVQPRVYAKHLYEQNGVHFMIVGLDFYDTQIIKSLETLVTNINTQKFLEKKNMLIGAGVKKFFDEYAYYDYYIFRPPDRSKQKIYIYDELPHESALISSDLILMDMQNARLVLGVKEEYASDIILDVPNPDERAKVYEKLLISHFDTRITTKEMLKRSYQDIFNYKGGLFLSLYIMSLLSFLFILYARFSIIGTQETKEVALLRQVGWRIDEIIGLHLLQSFIIALFAFLLGLILALVFVFYLDAPLLRNIFLGADNLQNMASFSLHIEFSTLLMLFLLFVVPFLLATLIPLWRLASKDTGELLR